MPRDATNLIADMYADVCMQIGALERMQGMDNPPMSRDAIDQLLKLRRKDLERLWPGHPDNQNLTIVARATSKSRTDALLFTRRPR